ncbi:MAG: hypothetical protein ACK5LN_00540, partial [Propioniciclava sp.]
MRTPVRRRLNRALRPYVIIWMALLLGVASYAGASGTLPTLLLLGIIIVGLVVIGVVLMRAVSQHRHAGTDRRPPLDSPSQERG